MLVPQGTPAPGTLGGSGGSVGAGKSCILEELSIILAPTIDKTELNRLIESSRVVRKDVSTSCRTCCSLRAVVYVL